MHDGMPYGRNQGQGQGHSREVDRQSPTGLIFSFIGYHDAINKQITNHSIFISVRSNPTETVDRTDYTIIQ